MRISRRHFVRLVSLLTPGISALTACQHDGTNDSDQIAGAQPGSTPTPQQPTRRGLSSLRDFGSDWQSFWGCDIENRGGRLGVLIDGNNLYEGHTLDSANDYTGLVTAKNLSPGSHSYQIFIDGEAAGPLHTFRTAPAPGDDFEMLFIGDAHRSVDIAFEQIINREKHAAFAFATEAYYLDDRDLYGGQLYADSQDLSPTSTNTLSYFKKLNGAAGKAGFRTKYRQALLDEPNRHAAMNTWPMFNMPHNHDMAASDPPAAPGTVRYDAAHKALFEYPSNGNPTASGIPLDSEPSPLLYFNKQVGDVEFIVPDMLSYSAPFAAGEMLGSNGNGAGEDRQIEWLKNRVAGSTARFIVLLMQKPALGAEWYSPTTGILPFLNGIDKTIIAITANTHNQHAQLIRQDMPDRPLLEIGASAFSASSSSSGFYIPPANKIYYSLSHQEHLLTVDYSGGTSLFLNDTSMMRNNRKLGVFLDNGGTAPVFIKQIISASEVVLAKELPGPASAGNKVYYYDWSDTNDIIASPSSTQACYGKLLVRPSGTQEAPYPHLEAQIRQTFSDRIFWRAIVAEGQRVPTIVQKF